MVILTYNDQLYTLYSNFTLDELDNVKVAIEACGLQFYILAQAYNAIGEKLPDHFGLYVLETEWESQGKSINLFSEASFEIRRYLLKKYRGMGYKLSDKTFMDMRLTLTPEQLDELVSRYDDYRLTGKSVYDDWE